MFFPEKEPQIIWKTCPRTSSQQIRRPLSCLLPLQLHQTERMHLDFCESKPTLPTYQPLSKVPEAELENSNKTCLCFYNKKNEQVWPCYKEADWQERKCSRQPTPSRWAVWTLSTSDATLSATASTPTSPRNRRSRVCVPRPSGCVSESIRRRRIWQLWVERFRRGSSELGWVSDDRLVKFWDIQPSTTMSPIIKKKEERDKAYGYSVRTFLNEEVTGSSGSQR